MRTLVFNFHDYLPGHVFFVFWLLNKTVFDGDSYRRTAGLRYDWESSEKEIKRKLEFCWNGTKLVEANNSTSIFQKRGFKKRHVHLCKKIFSFDDLHPALRFQKQKKTCQTEHQNHMQMLDECWLQIPILGCVPIDRRRLIDTRGGDILLPMFVYSNLKLTSDMNRFHQPNEKNHRRLGPGFL